MPRFGLKGAVCAIAIDGARARVRQIAVPYLIGEFRQLDPLDFFFARVIEKTQFNLSRMGGEQGKVDAQAIPSRTFRIGQPFVNS